MPNRKTTLASEALSVLGTTPSNLQAEMEEQLHVLCELGIKLDSSAREMLSSCKTSAHLSRVARTLRDKYFNELESHRDYKREPKFKRYTVNEGIAACGYIHV